MSTRRLVSHGPQSRLVREDGAAAVEFALVVSLLMVLVFGIIGFGQAFGKYEVLQGAAREGGRLAAVRGSASDVVARVEDAAAPYTLSTAPQVSRTCDDSTTGMPVVVGWDQVFRVSIPFLPAVNETVHIQAEFRCE